MDALDKAKMAHRKKRKQAEREKMHKVMGEFKDGTLKSGSGQKVTSREQAIAIGLSEARRMKRK